MKIQYQETSIISVMQYFAKSFDLPEDIVLYKADWNYDCRTGTVIFKLYLLEKRAGKEKAGK